MQIETGWKELKSSYRESRFQVGYHMERSPSLPLGSSPSAATGGSVSSDVGEAEMDIGDVQLTSIDQVLVKLREFMFGKPRSFFRNVGQFFEQYSNLEKDAEKLDFKTLLSDELSVMFDLSDRLSEGEKKRFFLEFGDNVAEPPRKKKRTEAPPLRVRRGITFRIYVPEEGQIIQKVCTLLYDCCFEKYGFVF